MLKHAFLLALVGAMHGVGASFNGGPLFGGSAGANGPMNKANVHNHPSLRRRSSDAVPVVTAADGSAMSVTAWLQQDKHWHTFRSDQPIYKALWFSSVALPVDIAYVKVEGTGTRGAVFVSPGNTEPLEKYAETIFNLVEQGYAPVYGIDHRGQGRSSRLIKDGTRSGDHYYTRENTYKSHVEDRGDFVADFRQFVNANIAGLPAGKPRYILCHSMGCAVTFLYLIDEQARGMAPKFNAVAANAPLVQPTTDPFTFAQAEWIAYLQVLAGFGTSYPPTLGGTLDEHWDEAKFATASTASYTRWKAMQGLCLEERDTLYPAGHTGLCIGSATANMAEQITKMYGDFTAFQAQAGNLQVPILMQQAGLDRTVVNPPMTDFCDQAFDHCTLTEYAGSQHNIWWETDAIRTPALNEVYAFYDGHAATTTTAAAPTTTTTRKKKSCKWWQWWC